MKKIIISLLVLLTIIALSISASANENNDTSDDVLNLRSMSKEEFNKTYVEENPDSYFLPDAYLGIVYAYNKEFDDYFKQEFGKYNFPMPSSDDTVIDEKGKIAYPWKFREGDPSYCGYPYRAHYKNIESFRISDLYQLGPDTDTSKNECVIMSFLAPWSLYTGEKLYTWNDLMDMSPEELNELDFTSYSFKRFIGNVKPEMEKRGWWESEYETLYTKLLSHAGDYDKAHEGEIYYVNQDGEKIYISEIIRMYKFTVEYFGDTINVFAGRRALYVYGFYNFNPYTKEFSDWFLSITDSLDEAENKFIEDMTTFCQSIYPDYEDILEYTPEITIPESGIVDDNLVNIFTNTEGVADYLGFDFGYLDDEFYGRWITLRKIFIAYDQNKITKEQVRDILDKLAYIGGTRRQQDYYSFIIEGSWKNLLDASMGKSWGGIVLSYDYNIYDRYAIVDRYSLLDEEDLAIIDDPERVINAYIQAKDYYSGNDRYLANINQSIAAIRAYQPKTGDNTGVYVVLLIVSLLGLAVPVCYKHLVH